MDEWPTGVHLFHVMLIDSAIYSKKYSILEFLRIFRIFMKTQPVIVKFIPKLLKKLDGILYPEEATIAGVMEIEKRHINFQNSTSVSVFGYTSIIITRSTITALLLNTINGIIQIRERTCKSHSRNILLVDIEIKDLR
uniref:Uncharacterized protein n=1 Tax=Rhizophagus irregularis (strain DAOM 181602 / DAOM 197198 / MUCL 43194) TaxID=747089 RepID=U9UTK1_RHIID